MLPENHSSVPKPTDQLYARRYLETRAQGVTFALYFRRAAKAMACRLVIYAVALTILAQVDMWPLFWLCLGLVLGSTLRDVGWVRAGKKSWPFTEKVTDWEKVRELAETQP